MHAITAIAARAADLDPNRGKWMTVIGFLGIVAAVLIIGEIGARRRRRANRRCNLCGARPHEDGCPALHARGWAFGDRRTDRREHTDRRHR